MSGTVQGPIGSLGAVPTLIVGGKSFTDLTNLITLYGAIGGSAASFCSFRKQDGTAGYSPSGVTFRCGGIKALASVAGSFAIGYCDNDLGLPSGTSPTNPVYIAGFGSTATPFTAQTAQYLGDSFDFTVPAGKFLFAYGGLSTLNCIIQVVGYEA